MESNKNNVELVPGYYSRIFLANAKSEIDACITEVLNSHGPVDNMDDYIAEAIALLAKAWHVRHMSDTRFEKITGDELDWLRHSIPDLAPIPGGLRIVNRDETPS